MVATALGPFSPVFVNDGLTLDFLDTDEEFPVYHFCFRVNDAEFDAIFARIMAAGIAFRSTVRGPVDTRSAPSFWAAVASTGTSPKATSGKC